MREENKNLKAKLKKEKAISKLAEDCVYDIEDALYRGEKNDWATEEIDEFKERIKRRIIMAYICTKEINCKKCKYFRYDEDNERMACFAEKDTKESKQKFLKIIDNEIIEFRRKFTSLTPTAVYKDSYKINFIEMYYNLFTSTADEMDEDVICWLNNHKYPLDFLYGEWLSCDGSFSDAWDDMSDWVKQLFNEENNNEIC